MHRIQTGSQWIDNGLSAEEAAWKTWSGQQAKEAGYTDVYVTDIDGGVEAVFTK